MLRLDTHPREAGMRTNIVIDPKLMGEALRLSGAPTKRQVVEDSLRLLIQIKKQEKIRQFRGKLRWVGNLDEMRRD
jgi:Arc/MetJ family transcription regulator